jgi:TetR/AcrR family transcriptional regulator, transcriptional repressor for nem operon
MTLRLLMLVGGILFVAMKQKYAPAASWSVQSIGYYMQAVLQGAFIYARAKQSPELATKCLRQLRRCLETLFGKPSNENRNEERSVVRSRSRS